MLPFLRYITISKIKLITFINGSVHPQQRNAPEIKRQHKAMAEYLLYNQQKTEENGMIKMGHAGHQYNSSSTRCKSLCMLGSRENQRVHLS